MYVSIVTQSCKRLVKNPVGFVYNAIFVHQRAFTPQFFDRTVLQLVYKLILKMNGATVISLLLLAMMMLTSAIVIPVQRPRPNRPGFPSFPGQGPFNPRPIPGPWSRPRFRRSPDSSIVNQVE